MGVGGGGGGGERGGLKVGFNTETLTIHLGT